MKSIKNIFLFTAAILLRTVSSDTTSYTLSSDQQITFDCDSGTCCTSEGSFEFPDSSSNFNCQDQNDKTCCSIGDNFGCSKDSCKVDCSTDCTVDVPGSVASTDGTVDTEGDPETTGSGDEAVDSEIGGDVTEGAGDQVTDSEIGTNGGQVTMGTGDVVSDSTIDGEAPVEVDSAACSGQGCGGGGWSACSGPDCNSGQVSTLAMATTVGILFAAAFLSI